ncbi:MAG: hypothetical protein QOF58_8842 [Pseudonocardiales bacterium]|jgi:hypothetical protein|nr:hypothetical protein [Pseudonocardiales bacterium]
MIELDDACSYFVFYAMAAGFGAVGGLVGELLKGDKGRFESARKIKNKAGSKTLSLKFGGWASIIVGAAAAMAVWWILPPKETIEAGKATTYSYTVFAVISLSIIVGSAGSAFLAAFQAKALAAIQVEEIKTQAANGVDEVAATAASNAPKEDVLKKADEVKSKLRSLGDSGIGNPDADDF